MIDSGATSSATFAEEDCTDVRECNVGVTAAGCSFIFKKMGTAKLRVFNEKGDLQTVTIADTLFSDKLPYRLLALQAFTNKGYTAFVDKNCMKISGRGTVPLVAFKDVTTALFMLRTVESALFRAQ